MRNAGGKRKAQRGFTLIELAIVITIIGLLIGGVLVGQDLIRSSELQTVTTDFQKYQSAAKQFQDQYYALPGDFSAAEGIWGQAAAGAGCTATVTVGKLTCNGNGNGRLESAPAGANSNELFRFWQQLNAAEILTDFYDGVAGTGGATDANPGENVPDSIVSDSGFTALWLGVLSGNAALFDGSYGNAVAFGRSTAAITSEAALTPGEAMLIDEKVDDGRPGQGKVVTNFGGGCTDAANAAATGATYQAAQEDLLCALIFRNAF